MLQRFARNRMGIFWVIFVGTVTIMVATGSWLVVMLVASNFASTFGAEATGPYTVQLGQSTITGGSAVVVIIDVGMVVWMAVSAFRKESQEAPIEL